PETASAAPTNAAMIMRGARISVTTGLVASSFNGTVTGPSMREAVKTMINKTRVPMMTTGAVSCGFFETPVRDKTTLNENCYDLFTQAILTNRLNKTLNFRPIATPLDW